MKKYFFITTLLFLSSFFSIAQAQDIKTDSIEVYLIDSYIAPEKPTIFNVSFFTSKPCTAELLLDNQYVFIISDSLSENHQAKLDLAGHNLSSKIVPFYIVVTDSSGKKNISENYNIDMPQEIKIEKESNFLLLGVFFGTVFMLPTPAYVRIEQSNHFALTKEIPIISFRSGNINYPFGYFAIEYTHIFKADASNFFRLGYKQLFETPVLKYIAPGISGFTNFDGFSGVGFEVSVGLFDIFQTFTVYSRYRFNTQPAIPDRNFHEIAIGLYSNFFSIHI